MVKGARGTGRLVRAGVISAVGVWSLGGGAPVMAQEAPTLPTRAGETTAADADPGEIIVTATKRAGGTALSNTPIAMSAITQEVLEQRNLRDLSNIAYSVPNVQLEGARGGHQNFSIRGQGLISTIPSIDPVVGLFVDGVYLANGGGVVFDTFDIASIEVLRGPQGLLFGRNVTAGAVLLNTTKPSTVFSASAKAAVESGPNYIFTARASGPLTADGSLTAKMAVYYQHDDGYFRNLFNGAKYGRNQQFAIRSALRHTAGRLDNILRYEYTRGSGQQQATQNHGLFRPGSADISLDAPGDGRMFGHLVSLTTNIDVGPGNGQITNIAAYRYLKEFDAVDSDASPSPTFNAYFGTRTKQYSDELRYSGTFNSIDVTTGIFLLQHEVDYVEKRSLFNNTVNLKGGGSQTSRSWAAFGQADIHLASDLTLNLGARYSEETKSVGVQRILTAATVACDYDAISCTNPNYVDKKKWNFFTPKVGLQWKPSNNTLVYGFWTKANRSGGYSLRWTSATPGPFNQETQNSYEIGLKQSLLDRKVQFNAALFHNDIKALIREVIVVDPTFGLIQTLTNTADARTQGFEAELTARLTPRLSVNAFVGYVTAKYTKILFDISGDGIVNQADFGLKPPRLSPWSSGAGVNYASDTWDGFVNFTYRDEAFVTDNNRGSVPKSYLLDAGLAYHVTPQLKLAVYGQNLLNRFEWTLDTPLPFIPNGSYSSLRKGRVLGASLTLTN